MAGERSGKIERAGRRWRERSAQMAGESGGNIERAGRRWREGVVKMAREHGGDRESTRRRLSEDRKVLGGAVGAVLWAQGSAQKHVVGHKPQKTSQFLRECPVPTRPFGTRMTVYHVNVRVFSRMTVYCACAQIALGHCPSDTPTFLRVSARHLKSS
jgi:hypothetical protein